MSEPGGRRLRLAQVVTRMDIGGVPDHIMTLVRQLHVDFDIAIICGQIDDQHRQELEKLGIDIKIIPFRRLLSPFADARTFLALRSIFKTGKFDIVHTHMSKAVLIGSIAAKWMRVPLIVNTAHNLGFIALPNRALRLLFWVYDFLLSRLFIDRVITVSDKVRDRIVATRMLPTKRVAAIHNGMYIDKFEVPQMELAARRQELLAGPDDVLIVCVARLVWFKGLSTLVEAMPDIVRSVPKSRFVVVGDGPLKAELTAQAESLGMGNRLQLIGERRDIPAILRASDLFVLPSVSEGLPISIMEAMAAGLPVVATDVGGIAELVEEGKTGLLVPSRQPGALASALIKLANNPKWRQTFGANGKQRIATEFSPSKMARCTAALYRDSLSDRGGRG